MCKCDPPPRAHPNDPGQCCARDIVKSFPPKWERFFVWFVQYQPRVCKHKVQQTTPPKMELRFVSSSHYRVPSQSPSEGLASFLSACYCSVSVNAEQKARFQIMERVTGSNPVDRGISQLTASLWWAFGNGCLRRYTPIWTINNDTLKWSNKCHLEL